MKKLLPICLISVCCMPTFASRFTYPAVSLSFPSGLPSTVFFGETLKLPLQMDFSALRVYKEWVLPSGTTLEVSGGYCPALSGDELTYWSGRCLMNVVISGDRIGKVISGAIRYHVFGKDGHWPRQHHWDQNYYTPSFSVTVIPHPLSMSAIPIQEATANQEFVYNLKSVVRFYEENNLAGTAAQGVVYPSEQDGLRFDQTSFSIIGKPKRVGTYVFQVGAKNAYSTAAPTELKIEVGINKKDKPRFKKEGALITAMPNSKYSMNLMGLMESPEDYTLSNQIAFRMQPNLENPEWLHLASDDATRLEGRVPDGLAGTEVKFTLVASSNTGGDSEPFTVTLPIATDPTQKPVIKPFSLELIPGVLMHEDLSSYISDPTQDPNSVLILEKIEPEAPWLSISALNHRVLEGVVPIEATGQQYQLTLRASNVVGGSSDPVKIPLQVGVNKALVPLFKENNPILPLVYSGQSYFYDFVAHSDIFPEYDEVPYVIDFAEGYEHPSWLKIVENQLIAELVPELKDSALSLFLRVKNTPGGLSDVMPLRLTVMN